MICIGYTLRLWSIGFASGAVVGYALGVALGWSKSFSYWGMPVLKLIGPVPATAWIPCTFFFFPTTFAASVFIVALSAGIPVAILTSSGVASVNRAYYDVGRNLGASEWYLVSKIAAPASLPHVFVGLFMALYYSFAVLVVAEMLGANSPPARGASRTLSPSSIALLRKSSNAIAMGSSSAPSNGFTLAAEKPWSTGMGAIGP